MTLRSSIAVLVALAPPLISWVPDWGRDDWPRELLLHTCADITLPVQSEIAVECGQRNTVALLRTAVDTNVAARLQAAPAWFTGVATGIRRAGVRVSIWGEYVIVEKTTCGACARVMGTTWTIRPSLVSASTLTLVQQMAGVRSSPPLRTVDAWRRARP